ncbi:MAG: TIGR01841 family phasin [Alphaproteobacteria bacterium]|nr:TIGR01841 family phasin [Alphaproteobacteria bacterium]
MNYANAFADMFKNNFDYNQVLTTQRRNMEAASEASQAMVENVQAISRRQAEIARETVEGALKASKDIFTSGTPETNIAKQAAYAKGAFENALSNLREVSEMAAKSCFEIFDVVTSRASESIEELSKASGVAAPATKKKSA